MTRAGTIGGLWFEGKLADKVVGVFTSSSTLHGGQETTIASLFNVFAHWGAIIVPLGYTDEAFFTTGNPYGASSTGESTEEELPAARHQGRRRRRESGGARPEPGIGTRPGPSSP